MKSNNNILIFIDWFIPGYKAGGPIRSVLNLVQHLSGRLNFHIVTSDRDLGDKIPYLNINTNKWINNSDYSIIYLPKNKQNRNNYKKILNEVNPNFIYLNSLFSFKFSILPLLSLKNQNTNIILSPRGMLGESSLKIKLVKKNIFFFFSKLVRLYSDVIWIASSEIEKKEIISKFGKNVNIKVIPNLPIKHNKLKLNYIDKVEGEIHLLCICRISPIKNIEFLINLLEKVAANVKLSIVGPIENSSYWLECLKGIKALKNNVEVIYLGEISPNNIASLFEKHHLLVSSSFNENYGHSIVEALSYGCPVIVSNNTPWRKLADFFAGNNLELDAQLYVNKIQDYAKMDNVTFLKYRIGANDYFKKKIDLDVFKENYIQVFS